MFAGSGFWSVLKPLNVVMNNETTQNLTLALQGLSDVFMVSLVLLDEMGTKLVDWKFPSAVDADVPEVWQADEARFDEDGFAILQRSGGRRRFLVSFGLSEKRRLFVQSGSLPESYAWTDGTLIPQLSHGSPSVMNPKVSFLLGFLRSRALPSERPESEGHQ